MPKIKQKYEYNGISFDSSEEIQFFIFLEDLQRLGVILSFEYQPKSFSLIPKAVDHIPVKRKSGSTVYKDKVLYREHVYTADFKVKINKDLYFNTVLSNCKKLRLSNDNSEFYVDVKGSYNRHGGDRIFTVNQKLVYFIHGIHINKINPDELFASIGFVPERLRWMKNRKVKTLYSKYVSLKSLDDILKEDVNCNKTDKLNIEFLPKLKHA